jgi:hypothetical protein
VLENFAAFFTQNALNLLEILQLVWLGQEFQAQLHPLEVVLVKRVLPFKRKRVFGLRNLLAFFQHSADDQNGVDGHLLKGEGQFLLGFYG